MDTTVVAVPLTWPHVEDSTPAWMPYTVACRACGRRLHVTDEEFRASLDEAPLCWPCDH